MIMLYESIIYVVFIVFMVVCKLILNDVVFLLNFGFV